MKALAILRVSTTTQTIDEQKEELVSFLKEQGYDEIIPIEAVGASAIKMDDKYLELCDKVKSTILDDKEIKAAGVWELSRLGRNEIILFQFKEFFIQHGIQFICKQPYMKLLEEDGSVNAGMELAFSLFATMSRQEMQEKKARFKRAKKGMAQRGEYIGGHVVPYGYTVVGRELKINEDEAEVIRLAFELYSKGGYSASSLSKELNERGYNVNDRKVSRMLAYRGYLGEPIGELGTRLPQIITKEMFDACQEVRSDNKLNMRNSDGLVLGSKLIRCHSCGAICTSNSKHYVCCRAAHKLDCTNTFHIKKHVADELLWRVASTNHIQYLMDMNENKAEVYRKELEVLDGKIAACEVKGIEFDGKKERIIDSYIEGKISKENRDLRLEKIQDNIRVHREHLTSLQGKRRAIARMLEDGSADSVEAFTSALETMDNETKFDVIHQHIKSLIPKQVSYGVRDPRCTRPNGVEIEIKTTLEEVYKFLYFPKYYNHHNLYFWNGRKWCEDAI